MTYGRHTISLCFTLIALSLPLVANATPNTMGYNGRILDGTGEPLNTTGTTLRISLHTHQTDPAEVWFETEIVDIQDGYFHVTLGDSTALAPALRANDALWVETSISGVAMGPRQRLNGAPYAIQGDTLADLQCSDGDGIRYNGSTSSWECRATEFIEFECVPTEWGYTTGSICSTTITLAQPSMVVATVTGHWYASSPACTLEILFGTEAINSVYSAKNGLHTYSPVWDDLAFTRAKLLGAGTHAVQYYTQGNCNINGSGLHGYIIPQ